MADLSFLDNERRRFQAIEQVERKKPQKKKEEDEGPSIAEQVSRIAPTLIGGPGGEVSAFIPLLADAIMNAEGGIAGQGLFPTYNVAAAQRAEQIGANQDQLGDLAGGFQQGLGQFGENIGRGFNPVHEFIFGPKPPGDDARQPGDFRFTSDQNEARRFQEQYQTALKSLTDLDRVNLQELTPDQQEAYDEALQVAQDTLSQAEEDLAEHFRISNVQDMLWNAQERALFGDTGLLPGVSDDEAKRLSEALDISEIGAQPGLQLEVLQAIDHIMNSNLSAAEKEDRLDFVVHQAEIKTQILEAIGDISDNREDIRNFLAMTPQEAIEAMGDEVDFVNPQYRWDLQPDFATRNEVAMGQVVEDYIETVTGAPIEGALLEDITAILDNVTTIPGFHQTPQFQQMAEAIAAKAPGVTAVGLLQAITQGIDEGLQVNRMYDNAFASSVYQPGGKQLSIAIYLAALGGDIPQLADLSATERAHVGTMLAESKALHGVIMAKSQGKIGYQGTGSQRGIGGISTRWYEAKGYDPDNLSTEDEFEALVQYVMEKGGPVQALQGWLIHDEWGD